MIRAGEGNKLPAICIFQIIDEIFESGEGGEREEKIIIELIYG